MICPKCKKFSKKLNEIFKNKTYKSISIILLFIVLVLFIFFIKFFNKEDSKDNIPKETIYDDTYIIPENKKAVVTFTENDIDIREEREIDREKIKEYFSTLAFNVPEKFVAINWATLEKKGAFYYIEYYDQSLNSEINFYGVIMFYNLVYMNDSYSSDVFFRTYVACKTNMFAEPGYLYDSGSIRYQPDNIETIRNAKIMSLLNMSLPSTASNIRIGFINTSDNEWLANSSESDSIENNVNIENNTNTSNSKSQSNESTKTIDFPNPQVVTTDLNNEYISALIEEEINNYMIENIENQETIQVVIKNEATDEQIYNLGEQIKNIPGVNTTDYISKENTYNEMKNRLANRQELLEILDPSMVSASFIVTLVDLSLKDSIQNQINKLDKLDNIKKII